MIFSRSSFAAASFENSQSDTLPAAGDNASLNFRVICTCSSFSVQSAFQEAVLDLCRGTDDDFVDVNLGRLLDDERRGCESRCGFVHG